VLWGRFLHCTSVVCVLLLPLSPFPEPECPLEDAANDCLAEDVANDCVAVGAPPLEDDGKLEHGFTCCVVAEPKLRIRKKVVVWNMWMKRLSILGLLTKLDQRGSRCCASIKIPVQFDAYGPSHHVKCDDTAIVEHHLECQKSLEAITNTSLAIDLR